MAHLGGGNQILDDLAQIRLVELAGREPARVSHVYVKAGVRVSLGYVCRWGTCVAGVGWDGVGLHDIRACRHLEHAALGMVALGRNGDELGLGGWRQGQVLDGDLATR